MTGTPHDSSTDSARLKEAVEELEFLTKSPAASARRVRSRKRRRPSSPPASSG